MKDKLRYITQRRKRYASDSEAKSSGQRVTNETVAEAREDVLSGARKIIYPLTHSKHRVVMVSTVIILLAIVSFTSYMIIALYRIKSSSDFVYRVTQVVPFPIARVGGNFVSYENYLFELKRYIYYYNNVEKIDFTDPDYKPQLEDQKRRILDRVISNAYIRNIATQRNISVSDQEVDDRIDTLRRQNRLGNNDKVFRDTLKDFYNWSENDFRRSIHNDILISKVLAVIDVDARARINSAIEELQNGTDFSTVAAKYSDDELTRGNGGEIAGFINLRDRSLLSEQADAISGLGVGQYSEVLSLSSGFEIIKKLEDRDDGSYRIARIVVNFKPINEVLNDFKANDKATTYLRL